MADDEERGPENSMTDVRTVLLGEIARIFEDTLGCAGDEIRRLYEENEALKSGGQGGVPSIGNFNLQGITDEQLQRIIDYVQSNSDGIIN